MKPGSFLSVLTVALLLPAAAATAQSPGPQSPDPGLATVAARAVLGQVTAADRVLGRADAPVTIVTYASFTCPHCAQWHDQVLPDLRARFIDTGKVKLVYRDIPTPPRREAMLAAALGRCAAPEAFFMVADGLFAGQTAVRNGGDPEIWLRSAAWLAGRPVAELVDCMVDPATAAAIEAGARSAFAADITTTPSFLVNGVRAEGDLDALSAAIAAHLPPDA